MGAAVDYISDLGLENIHSYEQELGGYLYEKARFLFITSLLIFHLRSLAVNFCLLKPAARLILDNC
jgi:hypothetical protein